MNRLPQISVILCVVLLFGVGCNNATQSSGSVKSRWLEGEPCAPPCWENIHPGTTILEEAVQLLESNSSVGSENFAVVNDEGLTMVTWGFQDSDWVGTIALLEGEDESVPFIAFETPDLCLGEIIDAYGKPDYLIQTLYEFNGTIYLIWFSQGFFYSNFDLLDETDKQITKSLCGYGITHFPVGTPMTELPMSQLFSLTENDLTPWQGYGEY